MMIQESKVNNVFHALQNQRARHIIKQLGINQALSFTEIMESVNMTKAKSSTLSHTIKLLVRLKMITRDKRKGYYFLTRTGLESIKIIDHFERFYTEYSMSDVNSEGTVEKYCLVVRRKKL